MTNYNRGPSRSEVQLLPACLDDYVGPDCAARFIDAFVEGLDFGALGFQHAQPAKTGRPAYHPADLLKLYLYGYLNRIRSSRRLEAEAKRNLELIWLMRGLQPDFKTIADFRKDNRKAFKPVFKQFNLLCRKLDLFGAELVAVDGTKFKASNNSRRHYTPEQLQELIERIERRIDDYLRGLDGQDAQSQGVPANPQAQQLQAKVALLKERKGNYDQLLGELGQNQHQEVCLTDAQAGKMKGPHGHVIGYNVQVAVDGKQGLIVAEEVVQAKNDLQQLAALAIAAKEQLGVEKLQAVADKGYHSADELERCEQAAVETFVPTDPRKNPGALFPKEKFRYESASDCYRCPAGQVLTRQGQDRNHGKERFLYFNRAACRNCTLRAQCTKRQWRVIARRNNEAVVERAAERASARADIIARRKEIVEHVFGTLRNWGHDTFLLRGLEKVRAEFSLSALVYNLRRVLSLVSLNRLVGALT
jgi:transposase